MNEKLLLPAYYFPPISYFQEIAHLDVPIVLDQSEHFIKQSYRTRIKIGTANGILELFIPIIHGRKTHVAMKEIRISDDHPWQRLHWQSIQTAYRSSAYFEFYEDDLAYFYTEKFDFLMDYHVRQLEVILKMLKLNRTISLSEEFTPYTSNTDYRLSIHPKNVNNSKEIKPYYQVFEDRQGFIPDLSILALICNQGPHSKLYI